MCWLGVETQSYLYLREADSQDTWVGMRVIGKGEDGKDAKRGYLPRCCQLDLLAELVRRLEGVGCDEICWHVGCDGMV